MNNTKPTKIRGEHRCSSGIVGTSCSSCETVERARVAQWVRWLDYLTTNASLSPKRRGFTPGCVNYKKGYTRLAAASDKVYQLLVHGQWFSPGSPASSITKTGRYDIAEILLKVALRHKQSPTKPIMWNRRRLTLIKYPVTIHEWQYMIVSTTDHIRGHLWLIYSVTVK